jgi:hypothetical protein
MSGVDTVFLILILGVGFVAMYMPRALIWLAAIAANFFVSSAFWRMGLGQGELVAGLCDAAMVAGLVIFGLMVWELWLAGIFLVSLAVNIGYLYSNMWGGQVIPHEAYAIGLELLTALALFVIGGTAAFQRGGQTDGIAFHPWVSIFGIARPFGRSRR